MSQKTGSVKPLDANEADKKKWNFFRHAIYESRFLARPDGIRLAVDVLLPESPSEGKRNSRYHAVFIQCRYMRGVAVRWPFKLLSGDRPIDVINQDLKLALLRAGYAVISMDVRGTGASFGKWRGLWSPEEAEDSLHILDWIAEQQWSSGQVALCGMSYEATAALFTLTKGHPSVKAAVLRFPFWDPFNEICCPGGIPQQKFAENWARVTLALDANNVGGLSRLLNIFFKGCQPVIEAQPPSGSVFSLAYWKSWLRYHRACKEGDMQLKAAVQGHASFDALQAIQKDRFSDEVDEQSNLSIKQVTICNHAAKLRQLTMPMLLIAGWLDATAAPAISIFAHVARTPGSQLYIGPWTHGGITSSPVGHRQRSQKSDFDQIAYVVNFLEQTFGQGSTHGKAQALKGRREPQLGSQPTTAPSAAEAPAPTSNSTGSEVTLSQDLGSGVDERSKSVSQRTLEAATSALVPTTVLHSPFTEDQDLETVLPDDNLVHFYAMGHQAGWRTCLSWPPQIGTSQPPKFYLSGVDGKEGALCASGPVTASAWQHTIDRWKHPRGQSRYECMTDLRTPMAYKDLAKCGHLLFTSRPLQNALELTGWAVIELWLSSCDDEADLFCYLESVDPTSNDVAYITEGTLRASHRKLVTESEASLRMALPAQLPQHSFARGDVKPLEPGVPVLCRFTMLPTSYTFAKGHCVRLAVSGSDAKHYVSDHACDGSRNMTIHSTAAQPSTLEFPGNNRR